MAQFEYYVTYGGKEVATGLYREVSDAIMGVGESLNIRQRDSGRPTGRYVAGNDEHRVLIGVSSFPGKVDLTDGVRLAFAGRESDILEFKSKLEEALPDLELR